MKPICVLTGVKNESDFLVDGLARVGNLEAAKMSATIKLGMALTVLIGALFIYSAWARVERNYGRAQAQAEYAALALAADQAAREKEQAMQAQITKAETDAKQRQKINEVAAAGAARAVVGLRTQLAASRSALSGATEAARAEYAAAADSVLSDCSEKYSGMAKDAAGHASDSLKLLSGWPK